MALLDAQGGTVPPTHVPMLRQTVSTMVLTCRDEQEATAVANACLSNGMAVAAPQLVPGELGSHWRVIAFESKTEEGTITVKRGVIQ